MANKILNNESITDNNIKSKFTKEDLDNLLALLEAYKYTDYIDKDISEVKAMIKQMEIEEEKQK